MRDQKAREQTMVSGVVVKALSIRVSAVSGALSRALLTLSFVKTCALGRKSERRTFGLKSETDFTWLS